MGYPAHWTRWSFGGALFTDETWTVNLTMGTPGGAGVVPGGDDQWWTFCDENIQKAYDAFRIFWLTPQSMATAGASFTWAKAAVLGPSGLYVGNRAPAYVEGPTTAGLGVEMPPQVALCFTNLTDIARGPGHNGRIYIPAGSRNSPAISSTGHITYGGITIWLTAYKALLEAMNRFTLGGSLASPRVSVTSRVTGLSTPVTKVRIGDVYDTQRRRRESIEEHYYSESITQTRGLPPSRVAGYTPSAAAEPS